MTSFTFQSSTSPCNQKITYIRVDEACKLCLIPRPSKANPSDVEYQWGDNAGKCGQGGAREEKIRTTTLALKPKTSSSPLPDAALATVALDAVNVRPAVRPDARD